MPNISKPAKLSVLWASGGDILDPGDTKYQTGWGVEVPPRQWENYIQNKQDQAIAHINQHGLAVWDEATEYQAETSYVQGPLTGEIYRAISTHQGQNPDLDTLGVYWEQPFVTPDYAYSKAEVDEKTAIANDTEARAWVSDAKLITPAKLASAFKGTNQSLTANGYQKLPGGLIMQWCEGTLINSTSGNVQQTVNFPITFPNGVLRVFVTTRQTANSGALGDAWCTAYTNTNSSAVVNMDVTVGGGVGQFAPILLVYGW